MNWGGNLITHLEWGKEISNRQSKEAIAKIISQQVKEGDVIGFGSGSTSYLAIVEIGKRINAENLNIKGIPTSHEVELACIKHNIPVGSFLEQKPDWCFDGADEIDGDKNLIKGRGGAMVKEKLMMAAAKKTFILADKSKFVKSLGSKFPVPIEFLPMALSSVEESLKRLGATDMQLRFGIRKDGPVISENGNFIMDVKFQNIYKGLEQEIKLLPGVLDSGLFMGFNVEVLTID
jgi:ribose 5-phosphate isomerase A